MATRKRMFLTKYLVLLLNIGVIQATLKTDLVKMGKCIGGRCLVVLPNEEYFDDRQKDNHKKSYSDDNILQLTLDQILKTLFTKTYQGVINPKTVVFIWTYMEDLLSFLSNCEGRESWIGEHYLKEMSPDLFLEGVTSHNISLRLDTKVFTINDKDMTVQEIFGISTSFTNVNIKQQIACRKWPCNPMNGIWLRRSDLSSLNLVAGFRPNPFIAIPAPGKNILGAIGFFPDVYLTLKQRLNFSSTIVVANDYGRPFRNGSFSGVVGMLQRREIDINFGSQSINFGRMQVTDFSATLYRSTLAVYIKFSGAFEVKMWQLLAVFEREAWVTYLIVAALVLVTFIALIKLVNNPTGFYHSTMQGIAYVCRTSVLRGYVISGRSSHAINFLSITFSFLSIVMFSYLTGGLLSKLAVRLATVEMSRLEDLIDYDMRLMMPGGGSMHATFVRSPPQSILGRLWAHCIKPYKDTTLVRDYGSKSLKNVVETDNYALASLRMTAQMSPLYPCKIRQMEETLYYVDQQLAYQKDSPLTEMFNFFLNRMRDEGVTHRIYNRHFKARDSDCAADADPVLGFNSAISIFLILISGVGVSFLLIGLETVLGCAGINTPKEVEKKQDKVEKEEEENARLAEELERLKSKVAEREAMIRKMKKGEYRKEQHP